VDSSVIYKAIYQYFVNYEYKLFNTFLFDWESDFFAESKSGYRVEVEVKVSRGDYFKDFEKPKHKLFQDWHNKKEWLIENLGSNGHFDHEARLIGYYNHKVVRFHYGPKGWKRGWKNDKFGYWVNDYGDADVWDHEHPIYAPATRIRIKPMAKILCPNQFYYACPAGLIKPEELPKYAGLIQINENGYATLIKKAPYLHKNHQDLTSRLLKKFYNLWQYKVDRNKKFEILTTNKEYAPDIDTSGEPEAV
jgi:hypothetical protein